MKQAGKWMEQIQISISTKHSEQANLVHLLNKMLWCLSTQDWLQTFRQVGARGESAKGRCHFGGTSAETMKQLMVSVLLGMFPVVSEIGDSKLPSWDVHTCFCSGKVVGDFNCWCQILFRYWNCTLARSNQWIANQGPIWINLHVSMKLLRFSCSHFSNRRKRYRKQCHFDPVH